MQTIGTHDQLLFDVIHEALRRHRQSLIVRERGVGHLLDSEMTDQDFHNQIGIDFNIDFPFDGNYFNCGTWTNKMDSSGKGKNKGYPATPRDGSAVELVGLSQTILAWYIDTNQ